MMKRQITAAVVVSLLLAFAFIKMNGSVKPQPSLSDETQMLTESPKPSSFAQSLPRMADAQPQPAKASPVKGGAPLTRQETDALAKTFEMLHKFSRVGATPEEFVAELNRMGLKPKKSREGSEETGFMSMIRTDESLEGTRYLHAQYVDDDKQMPYLQHMSFELRPGPDSMDTAMKIAKETFGITEPPSKQTEDFIEWNRAGRTLWIKKITDTEELFGDHFNARTEADRGLVVTALEVDPHAHSK